MKISREAAIEELTQLRGTEVTEESLLRVRRLTSGRSYLTQKQGLQMAFPIEYQRAQHLLNVHNKKGLVYLRYVMLNGNLPRCQECETYTSATSNRCRKCSPASVDHKQAIAKSFAQNGHPMRSEKVKKKFQKTMHIRHGVAWAGQSKDLREKAAQTCLRTHGVLHHSQTKESIERLRNREADPKFKRSKRARYIRTMTERYGKDWDLEQAQKMADARYKKKRIRIQGKTFICMGYEPVALSWLVQKGVSVERLSSKVKWVPYTSKSGRNRKYIPDIEVRTARGSILVEVKSSYTAGLSKDAPKQKGFWDSLQRKATGVEAIGKELCLIVCTSKGVLFTLKNPQNTRWSEARALYTDALARM